MLCARQCQWRKGPTSCLSKTLTHSTFCFCRVYFDPFGPSRNSSWKQLLGKDSIGVDSLVIAIRKIQAYPYRCAFSCQRNSIASSMALNLMAPCLMPQKLVAVTIRSRRSLVKPRVASTSLVPSTSTWNQLFATKSVLDITRVSITRSKSSTERKMLPTTMPAATTRSERRLLTWSLTAFASFPTTAPASKVF